MNQRNMVNRRTFCKGSLIAVTAGAVASPLIGGSPFGPSKAFAQVTKALDENSPMAQQLGYKHDSKKVDPVKFPRRKEPGADAQVCKNCALMVQGGLKADGVDGDWGRCGIFADGLVNLNGWCNSYVPKPA